jgi:hypothetical protein
VPSRTRRRRGHIEPFPSGPFRAVVFTGLDRLSRRRPYVKATRATRAADPLRPARPGIRLHGPVFTVVGRGAPGDGIDAVA